MLAVTQLGSGWEQPVPPASFGMQHSGIHKACCLYALKMNVNSMNQDENKMKQKCDNLWKRGYNEKVYN